MSSLWPRHPSHLRPRTRGVCDAQIHISHAAFETGVASTVPIARHVPVQNLLFQLRKTAALRSKASHSFFTHGCLNSFSAYCISMGRNNYIAERSRVLLTLYDKHQSLTWTLMIFTAMEEVVATVYLKLRVLNWGLIGRN